MSPDADAAARCAHCGGPLLDTHAVHFPERRGDEDARSPLVGRIVDGKYRVVGVLGRGGMGTVYRALHEVSLVPVALKVLHPRFAARQDFRAWFLGEARKAGRVVHESSARVMDVGVAHDGMVYIAVELVDGVTLQEWMADGPVAPSRVVLLLEQIARALAAAHAAGVVHRDLSPRNVMVTVRDGRSVAKILDFGIAIGPPLSLDAERGDAPSEGAPTGFANPPYSAPEHLAGEPVDGRADLYSLGVIAYEAITGELPVGGNTGRQLARATLEGRVRPLRARAGLPKSFVRLVNHLLARQPADRPSSADDVAERLARVRQPGRRVLAALSIVALVASTAAFAIAHAPTAVSEAYFGTRGVGLQVRAERGTATLQELRPAELQGTRFEFGGFRPADLWIDVATPPGRSRRIDIGPMLRVDGETLRFSSEAAPLLHELARLSAAGPIEVRFQVPDRAPLGYALLRVDGDAPRVTLRVARGDEGAPAVLRGDDRIEVAVEDDGALRSAALELTMLAGLDDRPDRLRIAFAEQRLEGSAHEVLGGRIDSTRSLGPVELRAVAVDAAGNIGRSAAIECADVDLFVPAIEAVASAKGGRLVVDEPEGPRLRIQLDGEEPGLTVLVRGPAAGSFREVSASAVGDRLDVRLPPAAGATGHLSGRWRFMVRDPAGNRSEWVEELEFRTADPGLELELEPADEGQRTLVRVGDQLVGSGEPCGLRLRHNSIYRVDRVRVLPLDGDAVERAITIQAVGPDHTSLVVGALLPGTYELDVRLVEVDAVEGRALEVPPWRLWILPPRVVLRIPAASGMTHLPELVERSVLRRDAVRIDQGAGWRLDPPDARLLRGRVWTGVGGRPVPQETLTPESPDASILAPALLGRGWHTIAVDLDDVLGRPVDVRLDDAPAPIVELPDGSTAAEVARFFHHDEPLALVEPISLVEHGQPVRVELRAAPGLPEADVAAIRARVAGAELAPRVAVMDGVARIWFLVPFERVSVAAELAELEPADYGKGVDAELPMRVWTPIGEVEVTLRLRTIRSTLREVRLEEIATRPLPPALRELRLVPVPAPDGPWPDPVPANAHGRHRYRPAPVIAVRNVPDFYLQDRETTRAQYAAIVRAGLEELARRDDGFDRARLVHRGDPLGVGRLTAAAMAPAAEDAASFLARVAADPARPVAGIDAFQAHAATGLLGLCVAGDPELFRLPLGCELEIAALGAGRPAQNGSAARGPGLSSARLAEVCRRAEFGVRWPCDADELVRCGDVVETELGAQVTGLDTGLREWVLDLPFQPGDTESRVLLEEWLADHARHVQQVRALADRAHADPVLRMPDDLRARAEIYGVTRGVALDPGLARRLGGAGALPADWPGVVTSLQLRRDGAGLVPGATDPRLAACGFRIAGGQRLVAEVRARW